MVQKIFTHEVYKMMVDAIEDYRSNLDGFEPNESYSVEVETEDCYFIDFEVQFDYEVHDDSFDHAFGTWHDPNPYLEPTNIIGIENVEVYKDDKKIENHNYNEEDFWGYYLFPDYGELKVGEKVSVRILTEDYECEFVSYNIKNGTYNVRLNGKDKEVHRIQKVA